MVKFGQVTDFNPKTGMATIAYIRPDACAKCGACSFMNQTGSIELKADCEVGNWVKVVLPDSRFMTATALAYIIPLLGFLIGLFAGYFLSGKSEGWAIAGSAIGLAVCVVGLRLNEKRIVGKPEWTPHVEAVYTEKPEMDDIGCQTV